MAGVKRAFLCKGDKAGSAMIIEGLETSFYSHDGPQRQLATVYMKTYCQACKKAGFICPVGPRWPGTAENHQMWALSGDINICDCKPAPVFFAQRNMNMTMTAEEVARVNNTHPANAANVATPANNDGYGKRFLLTDSNTGKRLANREFIVSIDGVEQDGRTDANGYAHVDAQRGQVIRLHMIFRAPAMQLKHEVA
jgi:hypothetical protein